MNDTEAIDAELADVIGRRATALDSDDPVILVTHAVIVAEVITAGTDGPQVSVQTIGDPSRWQVAGLLAAAQAHTNDQLVQMFRPDND